MTKRKGFKFLSGAVLAGAIAVVAVTNGGCSAAAGAASGCSGLDVKATAQANLSAWVDTVTALDGAATKVEGEWLAVCNKINGDLGLDTTQTTADKACGALNTYIKADLQKGVTITLTVSPPSCQANVSIQANCEAKCQASANCDVKANCTPGQLVVSCMGTCDAQCDVTEPSFACNGSATASYDNTNVCNNSNKQEASGFANLDAASGRVLQEELIEVGALDLKRAVVFLRQISIEAEGVADFTVAGDEFRSVFREEFAHLQL